MRIEFSSKQTRSQDPSQTLLLIMELQKNNQTLYKRQVTAASEVEGKIKASLELLRDLYAPQDPIWLELVAEVSQEVKQKRLERGAGEKPVLQKYDRTAVLPTVMLPTMVPVEHSAVTTTVIEID